jgi:hypothetical protein
MAIQAVFIEPCIDNLTDDKFLHQGKSNGFLSQVRLWPIILGLLRDIVLNLSLEIWWLSYPLTIIIGKRIYNIRIELELSIGL